MSPGLASQLIALLAALLPLAGVLNRYIAFRLYAPQLASLAWHDSLPNLIAGGVVTLVGPAAGAFVYFAAARALVPVSYALDGTKERLATVTPAADQRRELDELAARHDARTAWVQTTSLRLTELRAISEAEHLASAPSSVDLALDDLRNQAAVILVEAEQDEAAFTRLKGAIDKDLADLHDIEETINDAERSVPRWITRVLGPMGSDSGIRPKLLRSLLIAAAVATTALTPLPVLPSVVVGILGYWWILRVGRRVGQIAFSQVALPLVLTVLAAGALSGLHPGRIQPLGVTFQTGTPVPDGDYISIGTDEGNLYLVACDDPSDIVGVRADRVQTWRFLSSPDLQLQPSIVFILATRQPVHWGFLPTCS